MGLNSSSSSLSSVFVFFLLPDGLSLVVEEGLLPFELLCRDCAVALSAGGVPMYSDPWADDVDSGECEGKLSCACSVC